MVDEKNEAKEKQTAITDEKLTSFNTLQVLPQVRQHRQDRNSKGKNPFSRLTILQAHADA